MSMLRPSDEAKLGGDSDRSEGAYDALAELFLGEDAPAGSHLRLHDPDDDGPEQAAPRPATIETLVLGHLPVLAGPWVAQYARHLADTRAESIALVRVAGDQASIDLYSDQPRASANPAPDLDSAIEEALGVADRWVFRVDAPNEPAMATCGVVDAVTLLCGADDAAIVSAYRTIKRVLAPGRTEPAFEDELEPAEPTGPTQRVVIIGAPEEKAHEAAQKLGRAAEAFLETSIDAVVGPARLGPSSGVTLYRGPATLGAEGLARRIRERLTDAGPTHPAAAPHTNSNQATPLEATDTGGVDVSEVSVPTPGLDPAPLTPAASPAAPGRLSERLPGLRRLPVECPYDDSIELAVDADQRLHLLARHSPVACRAMAVVGAWARDHAPMLAALLPNEAFDATRPVAKHLFVERPAEARRLLDTDYQVHLLAPVTVEGRTGWCCVALNE